MIKHRSLLPLAVLAFSLVMVLAHLGNSGHPEKGPSRWVNADRSLALTIEEIPDLKKVTDTVLSTGFEVTSKITRNVAGDIPVTLPAKQKISTPGAIGYDTLLDCRYREREILKHTSLKKLALEKDGDDSFWNLAGLTFFEVDEEKSTPELLYCSFSYSNSFSKEQRYYVLIVDRQGHTRIEQA